MTAYKKVAIIAGAGALPHAVIEGAKASGTGVFVAALEGFSRPEDFTDPSKIFRLGDIGKLIKTLRKEKVEAVCMAGIVKRPNFSKLRPDLGGVKYLPGAIAAAAKGDDALLRYVTQILEKEGMTLIGPQILCVSILAPLGPIGDHALTQAQSVDALKARDIAKAIGALDIGQGAVVTSGLVLAVEAQEGTDAMLSRVADLPMDLKPSGSVLAKMVKPGQEDRVDLPTIGLTTVEGAIAAGVSAIVIEAGRAFILDKPAVIEAANSAGIAIVGLPVENGH